MTDTEQIREQYGKMYDAMIRKDADALEQAYSTRLAKEAMTMDAKMALNELEMLPQIPKGQYIDVYA